MRNEMNRCLAINQWLEKRHARIEANQRKLAFYYAAKAWPDGGKPEPVWFHWFHNWTLGCTAWKANEFAHKALAAWHRIGKGHYECRSRIWSLAMERYVMGK